MTLMRFTRHVGPLLLPLTLCVAPALSEEPRIDNVIARQAADGNWRFDVTISHPDTG